jgi:hypothetical protein
MKKVLEQEEEKPEYSQADIYVYQPMKTYVYTKPTFNHQVQNSLIHPHHLPIHAKALDIMKKYFFSTVHLQPSGPEQLHSYASFTDLCKSSEHHEEVPLFSTA